MALTSPGVEVTIVDESNYLPAATNSVPFVLIATAQNKVSGAGVGVAAGTTAANAKMLAMQHNGTLIDCEQTMVVLHGDLA